MRLSDSEEARLAERERTYWWHIAKRNFLRVVFRRFSIPERSEPWVLDVGGAGGETKELFGGETRFVVVEPAMTIPLLQSRVPLRVVARAEFLPFRPNQFDIVIAADVLEHIENDSHAVDEIGTIVRSGGYFLVTVPAYPALYSSHDEALGHFRRYQRKELLHLFPKSQWRILFLSSIFVFLLLGTILRRFRSPRGSPQPISSYVDVPGWFNQFLILWCKCEATWLRCSTWPMGTSLVLFAKKTNS